MFPLLKCFGSGTVESDVPDFYDDLIRSVDGNRPSKKLDDHFSSANGSLEGIVYE